MRSYFRTLGRSILGRKAASFNAESLAALLEGDVRADRVGTSYHSLARHGFMRNVMVYRALTDIARSCGSVPLDVFRGDNAKDKLPAHPLAKLLRRPNLRQSRATFLEYVVSHYLLDGNAFQVAHDGFEKGGPPVALESLRPDLVEVTRSRASGLPVTTYTYRPGAGQAGAEWRVSDADDRGAVLHLKTFHPLDPLRGLSPLHPARNPMDRHNLSEEWNANLVRNSAKPPGALVVQQGKEGHASLDEETRRVLKAELEEMIQGAANAGRPLILEGGLSWQQMGFSPVDMDWSEAKAAAARDAVNALGYPPMLLGIPGDNTFSNQREARLALWENTILPLLGMIVDEMTQWLAPRYGGELAIRPNLDQVTALAPRRERVWERVKGADWLSVNEARAETGLDQRPEPEANEVMVSTAKVPLSIQAAPPEDVAPMAEPDEDEDAPKPKPEE